MGDDRRHAHVYKLRLRVLDGRVGMASRVSIQIEELDLVGGLRRDVVNVFGFSISLAPSLVGTFSTPMTRLLTSVTLRSTFQFFDRYFVSSWSKGSITASSKTSSQVTVLLGLHRPLKGSGTRAFLQHGQEDLFSLALGDLRGSLSIVFSIGHLGQGGEQHLRVLILDQVALNVQNIALFLNRLLIDGVDLIGGLLLVIAEGGDVEVRLMDPYSQALTSETWREPRV